MKNKRDTGKPEDPLREVKQATVAIGTVPKAPRPPSDGPFYDGNLVDFELKGTGLIYAYTPMAHVPVNSPPDPKTGAVYYWAKMWIVTCKHCIHDTPVVAVRADTNDGTRVYPIRASRWSRHPNEDVAVTPFGLDGEAKDTADDVAAAAFRGLVVSSVGRELTATRDQIMRTGFWEGTPVSMIGFPAGMIEGGKKNYPVVRGGTIAQMQGYLDRDPEHRNFLIDGSIFGGNSGGPIVVRKGVMNCENQALSHTVLIGMVSAAVRVETERHDRSPGDVFENAGLVHGVSVDAINDTIHRYYVSSANSKKDFSS